MKIILKILIIQTKLHSLALPLPPSLYTWIFPVCHINGYILSTTQIVLAFLCFFNPENHRLQKEDVNVSEPQLWSNLTNLQAARRITYFLGVPTRLVYNLFCLTTLPPVGALGL